MTTNKGREEKPPPSRDPLIGVVGPCGAGKTSLIAGLQTHGFRTRHIAQEHSYVQDMWERITHPDILIFLDASYAVTCERRKLNWTEAEYTEQHNRLNHARLHADLYLSTDRLSAEEVLKQVLQFLRSLPAESA